MKAAAELEPGVAEPYFSACKWVFLRQQSKSVPAERRRSSGGIGSSYPVRARTCAMIKILHKAKRSCQCAMLLMLVVHLGLFFMRERGAGKKLLIMQNA